MPQLACQMDAGTDATPGDATVGVVVIGRNEGERFRRCVDSLLGQCSQIVYVDSGSTDGSVDYARSRGVHVLELDMARPFTMARARNAGLARLRQLMPGLAMVQFVDGDCQVEPGWIERAQRFLQARPSVAAVAGQRREQAPRATVYNRLIQMEWRCRRGASRSLGGDMMVRVAAFEAVGGFNERLIAGEEPELCVRLRGAGWLLWRLEEPMTLHDAALTRLGQWSKRTMRAGHAYAENAWLHGQGPERHRVGHVRSALMWGLAGPMGLVGTLVMGLAHEPRALVLSGLIVLGYAVLAGRIVQHRRRSMGESPGDALLYAFFCVAGKVPEAIGVLVYAARRLRQRPGRLIEYK